MPFITRTYHNSNGLVGVTEADGRVPLSDPTANALVRTLDPKSLQYDKRTARTALEEEVEKPGTFVLVGEKELKHSVSVVPYATFTRRNSTTK